MKENQHISTFGQGKKYVANILMMSSADRTKSISRVIVDSNRTVASYKQVVDVRHLIPATG